MEPRRRRPDRAAVRRRRRADPLGHDRLTVWDSSSNTVYSLPLPTRVSAGPNAQDQPPTLADIDSFLKQLAEQADVSGATPDSLAGEPAYRVTVSPAHSAGLIGSLELAWDADPRRPARDRRPRTGTVVTCSRAHRHGHLVRPRRRIGDLAVTPPANAKAVELGAGSAETPSEPSGQKVTGLAAVQAAVPFTLVAPDTLVGLPPTERPAARRRRQGRARPLRPGPRRHRPGRARSGRRSATTRRRSCRRSRSARPPDTSSRPSSAPSSSSTATASASCSPGRCPPRRQRRRPGASVDRTVRRAGRRARARQALRRA